MTVCPDTCDSSVIVLGGGMAGLSAAYALATRGLRPIVVEERGRGGGLVASAHSGGLRFDIGAESYVSSADTITNLLSEVGLDVCEPTGTSWVYSHEDGGRATQIPHGMLGVPASLDDPAVRDALTDGELARAREDLTMGPTPGADCRDLASFVRARYGDGVLAKLVAPIAGGIHSANPADLAVDTVCRGLRNALAREGSATAACASLRGLTPTRPTVIAPDGGLFRLPERLAEEVVARGGRVEGHTRALDLAREPGAWAVRVVRTRPGAHPADQPLPDGPSYTLRAPRLVIALPPGPALALLQKVDGVDVRGWEVPRGAPIAHVTLVLNGHDLDDGPRGSGMLVRRPTDPQIAAGCVRAKALTHYSYKWPWVMRDHPGTHVLRVSYGRPGEPPVDVTPDLGLAEAARLLGRAIPAEDVRASFVVRWDGALPALGAEHWDRVADLRAQLASIDALEVCGAWASGSGLSAVIPHALDAAERLAASDPYGRKRV